MIRLFPKTYREDELTPLNARTLLIVNLVVCPGLGTVMAGQRRGYLQAAMMLAGVCLVLGFAAVYFHAATTVLADPFGSEEEWWAALRRYAWVGISGFALCVVAWSWAFATSFLLLRRVRERARKPPPIQTDLAA